jgi:hypothetical protein
MTVPVSVCRHEVFWVCVSRLHMTPLGICTDNPSLLRLSPPGVYQFHAQKALAVLMGGCIFSHACQVARATVQMFQVVFCGRDAHTRQHLCSARKWSWSTPSLPRSSSHVMPPSPMRTHSPLTQSCKLKNVGAPLMFLLFRFPHSLCVSPPPTLSLLHATCRCGHMPRIPSRAPGRAYCPIPFLTSAPVCAAC